MPGLPESFSASARCPSTRSHCCVALEVQEHDHLILERRFSGSQVPLGVNQLGQRLAEQLRLSTDCQVLFPEPIEVAGGQDARTSVWRSSAVAVGVEVLDAAGIPGAGDLDKVAKGRCRGDLALAPAPLRASTRRLVGRGESNGLALQYHVPGGVDQDADFVVRRYWAA